MTQTTKSVILRFARGTVAGAVSAMLTISIANPSTWKEMSLMMSALALSGIIGAISGFLQAADKWVRSE